MGPAVGTQTETGYHVDIALQNEELVRKYEQMRQQVRFYREAHAILEERYRRDKVVWKQWIAQDTARRRKSENLKAHNAALGDLVDPAVPETRGSLVEPRGVTPYTSVSTPVSQVATGKRWSDSPPSTERTTSLGVNSLAPGVSEIASTRKHTGTTVHYDSDHTTDGEGEAHIATFSPLLTAMHGHGELREPPPMLPAKAKAEETTQCLDYIPIYIKSEPRSPTSVLDHISFTQQSLDLDDIGYKPKTPRKRSYMSSRPLQVNYEQENDSPTLLGKPLSDISNDQQKEGVAGPFDPFVNPVLPASQLFVVNELGSQANSQPPSPSTSTPTLTPTNVDQVEIQDLPAGVSAKILARPTSSIQPTNKELAQLLSRRRSKAAMFPPSGKPRGARRPQELKLLGSKLRFMTEDGTDSLTELPPAEVTPMPEQTLGTLLGTPPEKPLSIAHLRKSLGGAGSRGVTPTRVSSDPDGGIAKFTTPDISKQPGKHNIPITDPPVSKRSKYITRSERKPDCAMSAGGPRPSGMRGGKLRFCDAKELQASDFVIDANKAYGRSYAHQIVVRKHDERKCLPGCLKICCAGLKDFLEKAGMPPTVSNAPKWRSSPDPSSPQRGNKEKRDSGADQAREFINKVSKHRNLFERNNSPPGFWNSEFPNTQEAEERRKQAMESEKRRVAEMKREAKKGSGRYLFRDEVRRRG